jgi:hypothetical protein
MARYAISEYDYAMLPVAAKLGIEPREARLFMVADRAGSWSMRRASGRCSIDLEPDPTNIATSAPIPPVRASAAG